MLRQNQSQNPIRGFIGVPGCAVKPACGMPRNKLIGQERH